MIQFLDKNYTDLSAVSFFLIKKFYTIKISTIGNYKLNNFFLEDYIADCAQVLQVFCWY